jgi:exodeoxyribonuclease VII small subunit
MNDMSFEKAHQRLEEILEKMNSDESIDLEQSLNLFEEANSLITLCQNKLSSAQKRIDLLIKERDGSLSMSPEGSPQHEEMTLSLDSDME